MSEVQSSDSSISGWTIAFSLLRLPSIYTGREALNITLKALCRNAKGIQISNSPCDVFLRSQSFQLNTDKSSASNLSFAHPTKLNHVTTFYILLVLLQPQSSCGPIASTSVVASESYAERKRAHRLYGILYWRYAKNVEMERGPNCMKMIAKLVT